MNISDVNFCCGCNTCRLSCPHGCISMRTDSEGFITATVSAHTCTNCGICYHVCPMSAKSDDKESVQPEVYAAVAKNTFTLMRSASGGMFSLFAKAILDSGGKVFGCICDENFDVYQYGAEDIEDLDKLRRSKYVQSDTRNTFEEVKEVLNQKRPVLYTGTPCQIAGLKNYLKHPYNNLFLIDLICHGVPSNKMFKQNISYFSNRYSQKLRGYEFRLKTENEPDQYHYTHVLENGIKRGPFFKDPYFAAFYDCSSYCESCYHCPYATSKREGNITIGDFHWAKDYHPELARYSSIPRSISCLLVNDTKGKQLLERTSEEMLLIPSELKHILVRNKNLISPTPRPPKRDMIYQKINKWGYKTWANRYYLSSSYLSHYELYKKLAKFKNIFKGGR